MRARADFWSSWRRIATLSSAGKACKRPVGSGIATDPFIEGPSIETVQSSIAMRGMCENGGDVFRAGL